MMFEDLPKTIGMHLSTVSRVVKRKYAHTPQGVIELNGDFFTEGMIERGRRRNLTRIYSN